VCSIEADGMKKDRTRKVLTKNETRIAIPKMTSTSRRKNKNDRIAGRRFVEVSVITGVSLY
jgi:hypothetical protein